MLSTPVNCPAQENHNELSAFAGIYRIWNLPVRGLLYNKRAV